MDSEKEGYGTELCPVCTNPVGECVCCTECGHACPLEAGEPWCPVCSPSDQRTAESRAPEKGP